MQINERESGIFPNFMKVVKLCLILSYGNASVEAGFSINDGLLVENMKERTVVARRLVVDYVNSCGGVLKVKIQRPLIKAVRGSCARYRHYLEELRKESEQSRKRKMEKHGVMQEIQALSKKRQNLEKLRDAELFDIDRQLNDLSKKL